MTGRFHYPSITFFLCYILPQNPVMYWAIYVEASPSHSKHSPEYRARAPLRDIAHLSGILALLDGRP